MALDHDILQARCGYWVGRLSGAVERSPLRRLWLSHETARLVARLFSRGAAPIDAAELLALSAGVPGLTPSVTDQAARRFWSQALRLWGLRVTVEPRSFVPEITKALHALAQEGMPPGDLALEAPLRLAQLSGWPLPAAAAALPPDHDDPAWPSGFAARLASEAAESHGRLRALERDFARWQAGLPEVRSDSRLRDALVLLGTFHALSPRYVAETLGLTRQASARLLRQLEELGILRRAVKRQRWIIYLAENAAPARFVPESTSDTGAETAIDTLAIDRVLEDAYRALDRAAKGSEL